MTVLRPASFLWSRLVGGGGDQEVGRGIAVLRYPTILSLWMSGITPSCVLLRRVTIVAGRAPLCWRYTALLVVLLP